jgi:putative aldouronate transport system permease protein
MVKQPTGSRKKLYKLRVRLLGKKPGDIVFNSVLYFIILLFAFITLYPFLFVVIESLKSAIPTNTGIPQYSYGLGAYSYVFTKVDGLWQSFLWSIFIAGVAMVSHVFCVMMTAYPLSKPHLRGRRWILLFILFTMFFSGGLIPYYLLIRDLHLVNNPLVYVLPGLVSGFDIIIAKNFMAGIPSSFSESAQIDGATDYTIFLRIYLPLSKPIMATLALWTFVGKWNDWMTGLLYMPNRPQLALIQAFLRRILLAASTQAGGTADTEVLNLAASIRMAIIVVGMLPIVLMYPFVQKHFVKGVILGSIKE